MSNGSFLLDPGTPRLRFKRLVIRVTMSIVIVWGSPLTILAMVSLSGSYGALSLLVYFSFVLLCYVAGGLIGRFEKDTPIQYDLMGLDAPGVRPDCGQAFECSREPAG